MHCGIVVEEDCYYGQLITEIIRILRGHHEPQEELVFHAIIERLRIDTPGAVMVELGANWSYYSLWFVSQIKGGQAFCVEPDPGYLDVGRRNFRLNFLDATFVQAAIGSDVAMPISFVCESDGVERQVLVEDLTSLLERVPNGHIDVLLLDVQGAEWPFLEAAGSQLIQAVRFLFVSTHHHSISGDHLTHVRCIELLRSLGAHVIAEHTPTESYSGDGLIAASFDPNDRDLVVEISRARAAESAYGDPLWELARVEHERALLEAQVAALRRAWPRRAASAVVRRFRRIARPSGAG